MNKFVDDFPIIVPEGRYKGMRLYLENIYGVEHILPIEMYYLYQNAFKNNYKIFFLKCDAKHFITIPGEDLNFLKKSISDEKDFLKYCFSENVLKIKELQHLDILEFYKIAIEKKQIKAFFLHPNLKNNFYCFDIFLIVDRNFNLNEILNLNFNLIKVNSIIEYFSHNLIIEIMKKMYNLLDVQFKDYIVPYADKLKTQSYNVFDLQEKKDLDSFFKKYFEMCKNNSDLDFSEINKEIEILKNKLFDKESELRDKKLYIKLFSIKLCNQIFIFDEIIVSDTIFFTNFIQLSNGASSNFENNEPNISYDELQHYCLEDMYEYDEFKLYTVFHCVYQ